MNADVATPRDLWPPAACRMRVTYLSRTCAENAAVLLRLKHPGPPLHAYACPCCHDWHITSSAQVAREGPAPRKRPTEGAMR